MKSIERKLKNAPSSQVEEECDRIMRNVAMRLAERKIRCIALRIASNHREVMASRPKFVIDANRAGGLSSALQSLGYNVRDFRDDTPDDAIAQTLKGKVIITNNTEDFLAYAHQYELSIISMEGLRFADKDPSAKNKTAKMIQRACIELALPSKPHPWILYLKPSGKHIFTSIP